MERDRGESVARSRAQDAFRLALCCFRGFKKSVSAISSTVFCHNLTILAKAAGG